MATKPDLMGVLLSAFMLILIAALAVWGVRWFCVEYGGML